MGTKYWYMFCYDFNDTASIAADKKMIVDALVDDEPDSRKHYADLLSDAVSIPSRNDFILYMEKTQLRSDILSKTRAYKIFSADDDGAFGGRWTEVYRSSDAVEKLKAEKGLYGLAVIHSEEERQNFYNLRDEIHDICARSLESLEATIKQIDKAQVKICDFYERLR